MPTRRGKRRDYKNRKLTKKATQKTKSNQKKKKKNGGIGGGRGRVGKEMKM